MRVNPFEDTTDHTEIPQMCLIESDGDDSDVDIDMLRFFENVHFGKNMFINGIFHCCIYDPLYYKKRGNTVYKHHIIWPVAMVAIYFEVLV